MGGDHQAGSFGISWFSCRGFSTRGCFLLRLPRDPLRGCWGFGLRLFRPGRLPGGGHWGLSGRLRDLLRRVRFVGWVCRGLDNTPPLDDMVPTLAKALLLGRRARPLGFRSGGFGCGDAVPAAQGRLLSKSRLRLLPLNAATITRCVVSPAATARRLVPRGRAATRKVGAPTSDASRRVAAVALRVAEALAAPALQRTLGCQVRLHRHSQQNPLLEFVSVI